MGNPQPTVLLIEPHDGYFPEGFRKRLQSTFRDICFLHARKEDEGDILAKHPEIVVIVVPKEIFRGKEPSLFRAFLEELRSQFPDMLFCVVARDSFARDSLKNELSDLAQELGDLVYEFAAIGTHRDVERALRELLKFAAPVG